MILFALIGCMKVIYADYYNRSVRKDFPPLYREVLQSWVGESSDDLILRWGRPQDIIRLPEGNVVLCYEDSLQGDICFSRFLVDQKSTIIKTDTFGPGCFHWVEPYFIPPGEASSAKEDANDYIQ